MKPKYYLLSFLVLMSIISAPIVMALRGGTFFDESIENRKATVFPSLSNNKLKAFISEFEKYFNDHFGFRQNLISINATIRNKVFKTSSSPKVLVGLDGWYFYKMDHNIDIYRGIYPFIDSTHLLAIKTQQEFVEAYLKSQSIPYYLVFTPSKVSIYPEYLPDAGVEKKAQTVMDIVEDYLVKHSDLNVINVKPAVLAVKEKQQVYYKTDTHWNHQAAFAAYKTVIERLKKDGIIQASYFDLERNIPVKTGKFLGEFSNMMGNHSLFAEEEELIPDFDQSSILHKNSGENYEHMSKLFKAQGGTMPINYFVNEKALNKKRVLIFHDSFYANHSNLLGYATDFREVYFVWTRSINKDILDYIKPDLVINETTERYIYLLGNDAKSVFFQENNSKIDDFNCDIIGVERKLDKKLIQVQVRNIGKDTWSEAQEVRLVLLHKGADTGLRATLGKDIIKPNDVATFSIEVPSSWLKTYKLQMIQGGMYFGPRIKI